jgi:hypothetical protein
MSEAASFALSLIVIVLYILLIAGSIFLYLYIQKWWIEWRKRRKILTLLQGEQIDALLERSPFQIGHAQGDNGYRISDSRIEHAIVHFAATTLDAQLWVVEQEADSGKNNE